MADNDRDVKIYNLDEDSEEEFRKLDRDLAIKSKQHNLTSVHVRSIIHVGPASDIRVGLYWIFFFIWEWAV